MSRHFDRVKETATTTGTGNFTLAGAVSQFRAFSSVYSVGDEDVPYTIAGQTGTEWEVGYGSYSATNTLRRDTVVASSNANALVSFSAGTKDVFVTIHGPDANTMGRKLVISQGLYLP